MSVICGLTFLFWIETNPTRPSGFNLDQPHPLHFNPDKTHTTVVKCCELKKELTKFIFTQTHSHLLYSFTTTCERLCSENYKVPSLTDVLFFCDSIHKCNIKNTICHFRILKIIILNANTTHQKITKSPQ